MRSSEAFAPNSSPDQARAGELLDNLVRAVGDPQPVIGMLDAMVEDPDVSWLVQQIMRMDKDDRHWLSMFFACVGKPEKVRASWSGLDVIILETNTPSRAA